MHFTLAVFVAAVFWSALPVKVVAVAGSVYILVQTLKTIFPALGGWYAIALNIAISATALISTAQPGDLKTTQFWAAMMLAVASAAGIHGTVKSAIAGLAPAPAAPPVLQTMIDPNANNTKANFAAVMAKPEDAPAPAPTQTVVTSKSSLVVIGILFGGLGLAGALGCKTVTAGTPATAPTLPAGAVDQADATAYQTLKPAHDFAESISADVVNGKLHPTATQTQAIIALNKALNVADHAEQVYHNAGGGSAAAMSAAITGVLNAWASTQSALLAASTN